MEYGRVVFINCFLLASSDILFGNLIFIKPGSKIIKLKIKKRWIMIQSYKYCTQTVMITCYIWIIINDLTINVGNVTHCLFLNVKVLTKTSVVVNSAFWHIERTFQSFYSEHYWKLLNVSERQWWSKTKIHENTIFEVLIPATNNY